MYERIWKELKSGKNIEVYVTIIISLAGTLLGVIGIIKLKAILTLILLVLTLLAIDFLRERWLRQQFKEELFPRYTWLDIESKVAMRLRTAKNVKFIAIRPLQFIRGYEKILKDILRRNNGEIRLIIIDPKSKAINLIEQGRYINTNHQKLILDDICRYFKEDIIAGRLRIKLIDYIPSHIVTIIDEEKSDGVMFTTIYSFAQEDPQRPSEIITRKEEIKYSFFSYEFNSLWEKGTDFLC